MKSHNQLESVMDSKLFPLLLFIVSFVFVTLFSRSTSFLYVFEGIDPAMFKQMGMAILKGKTIYIDYFDNKGCLLYFLHALGMWLGGNLPILLMQAVSLFITLMIWNRILSLFCSIHRRIINLCILLFLLMCFYEGGDLSEEWCLPFASYPLLVYFRQTKRNKVINNNQMFGIGLCFGVIAFIRINNACSFLGFLAYFWIQYLSKKEYHSFFKSLIPFLFGTAFIAFFCTLYFYLKAGWFGIYEMVYATFLSNFEYIASKPKSNLFLNYLPYISFLGLTFVLLIINTAKEKDFFIPTLFSIIFFIISFGFKCRSHYFISILPLWIILLIHFKLKQPKINTLVSFALLFPLFIYTLRPMGFLVNDIILDRERFPIIYNDFHKCIESIPETERDSIYDYNLQGYASGMLQHEGLIQCNRVLYTPLLYKLPTLIREETSKPFVPPKWIMCSWNFKYYENEALFILNEYDLYCEFRYDALFLKKPKIGRDFTVSFYRRKY